MAVFVEIHAFLCSPFIAFKKGNNIDLEWKTHLLGGHSHLQSSAVPLIEMKVKFSYTTFFICTPAVNKNVTGKEEKGTRLCC